MPSTNRRVQSGQSLVEVLVASALLGVAVVVGLLTLATSNQGARLAVRQAWAECMVRAESEALQGAAMADPYPSGPSPYVTATVTGYLYGSTLQQVSIAAVDPDPPHPVLFKATVLKARALQGSTGFDLLARQIAAGCPAP